MSIGELAEKNTVQFAHGGDVVLVGEEHRNPLCGALFADVVEEIDPAAIGAEHLSSGPAAMGQARHYARLHDLPHVVIDDKGPLRRREGDIPTDKPRLRRIANTFREPIDDSGDVPRTSIETARRTIYEIYGEEIYDAMYDYREDAMADELERLVARYGGPVLGVVGTFHILAIKERLKPH